MITPLIVLPLLFVGLASLGRDVFNPRYVLNTVPAFMLLLIAGGCVAADFAHKALRANRAVWGIALLSPWVALAAMALHAYYTDPAFVKAPAWDELGEFLSRRVEEDDLVIQLSVDPAFAYYYDGAAPELALPAHPAQTADEIAAVLEKPGGPLSQRLCGGPRAGGLGERRGRRGLDAGESARDDADDCRRAAASPIRALDNRGRVRARSRPFRRCGRAGRSRALSAAFADWRACALDLLAAAGANGRGAEVLCPSVWRDPAEDGERALDAGRPVAPGGAGWIRPAGGRARPFAMSIICRRQGWRRATM